MSFGIKRTEQSHGVDTMFKRAMNAPLRSGWIGIVFLGVAFGHVTTAFA